MLEKIKGFISKYKDLLIAGVWLAAAITYGIRFIVTKNVLDGVPSLLFAIVSILDTVRYFKSRTED